MANTHAVYKISFIGTSHFYIGSCISFSERKIRHKYLLKKGTHRNKILQRCYNKYTANKMIFSIIERVENKSNLINREQFYIDKLKPDLNILKIAHSALGYKHTLETKNKLSKINTGKIMTESQNRKNSLAQKGNKNAKGAKRDDVFKNKLRQARSKKVIDMNTGIIYISALDAAIKKDVNKNTFYAKVQGRIKNDINCFYL